MSRSRAKCPIEQAITLNKRSCHIVSVPPAYKALTVAARRYLAQAGRTIVDLGPQHHFKRRLRPQIRSSAGATPDANRAAQICSDAIGFSHRLTCVKRTGMTWAS